jgi:hypothetical protein
VFIGEGWYDIADPRIPALLEPLADFTHMEFGTQKRRNGASIPPTQPFFPGVGDFLALTSVQQLDAVDCLAQGVTFAEKFEITLGDLHRDNYLYDPYKKEIALIDLDPHGFCQIPDVLVHQWISPKYGELHFDFSIACRLLRSLIIYGEVPISLTVL